MEYNVYCDETSHLKINKGDYMVIGAVYLPKNKVKNVNKYLNNLKIKHGLAPTDELKWNLIKNSSVELYETVLQYFFDGNNDIKFRAIAINKKEINNDLYNQTDNDFYHKMYYQMLEYIINPGNSYNIYPDIKDSDSYYKHQKVLEYLRFKKKDINKKTIKKIQPIHSEEAILLQLTDILIGALAYYNNYYNEQNKNENKNKILNLLIDNFNISDTTPLNYTKFNILYWRSKNDFEN